MTKLLTGLLVLLIAVPVTMAEESFGESPQSIMSEYGVTIPQYIGIRHLSAQYDSLTWDLGVQQSSWPFSWVPYYAEYNPSGAANVCTDDEQPIGVEVFCSYVNGWQVEGALDVNFVGGNKILIWVDTGINSGLAHDQEPAASDHTVREMSTTPTLISTNDVGYGNEWRTLKMQDPDMTWRDAAVCYKTYGAEEAEAHTLTLTITANP